MNPRLTFSFVSAAFLALATIGLVFKSDPAIAQQATEGIEEIVVEAPAVVTTRAVGIGKEGHEKISELKHSIDYADLDLGLHKDVTELEVRIEAAAREVCEELADLDPRLTKPEPSCIKNAVASAKEELQWAIAAASR
jgi:UrcA family protein